MADSGPDVLSCRRGLPTWEARRPIRNTPRPGGAPWRTAVGAVSLDRLFFLFLLFFCVVVAVWVLAVGTLDPCWRAAWNRPTPVAKCHHLAGLERDATRHWRVSTALLHRCTTGPCQPKAVARSRPPKWHPPPPQPGFAGHGIQTCSSCSSRQQQHIASRTPHATGRVRSVPKMGLAHRCHGVQGLSTNAFIYPSSPLLVQSLIDPGIPVSLSILLSRLALSSPGPIPNIGRKKVGVWCEPTFVCLSLPSLIKSTILGPFRAHSLCFPSFQAFDLYLADITGRPTSPTSTYTGGPLSRPHTLSIAASFDSVTLPTTLTPPTYTRFPTDRLPGPPIEESDEAKEPAKPPRSHEHG